MFIKSDASGIQLGRNSNSELYGLVRDSKHLGILCPFINANICICYSDAVQRPIE